MEGSFFRTGVYPKVDKIQEQIDYVQALIRQVACYLTGLIKKLVTTSVGPRTPFVLNLTIGKDTIIPSTNQMKNCSKEN